MRVTAAIITLLWIVWVGSRIWRTHSFERLTQAFGVDTGTAATDLVLIRLWDPKFSNPAVADLALENLVALPFLFIMFHVMNGPILSG